MWRVASLARRFSARQDFMNKILNQIQKFDSFNGAELSQTLNFSDAGLDQFDSMDIAMMVEHHLKVILSDEQALKITSMPKVMEIYERFTQK